jgi:hypothetical protein
MNGTLRVARRCRGIIMQNFIGTFAVDRMGVGMAARMAGKWSWISAVSELLKWAVRRRDARCCPCRPHVMVQNRPFGSVRLDFSAIRQSCRVGVDGKERDA